MRSLGWALIQQASWVVRTVKNLPTMQEIWFELWVRKIPWRRKWQGTHLVLPGESHGQRSLWAIVDSYFLWSRKAGHD